jgi:hypothetical protein
MNRASVTSVVERNQRWDGHFETEPWESAWATEGIFFIRALAADLSTGSTARVQISPDGMHWVDEGTEIELPTMQDQVTFGKIGHFGGWLRLVGDLPDGAGVTVIVYLSLKG